MESPAIICPICLDRVDKLLFRYHIDSERQVLDTIKRHNPAWTEKDGICSRCVDYYHTEIVMQQRMLPEIGPHFPVRSADDFVILPTGLRLDADPRYTGKGITICFIDSGFYPHPDLVAHRNRVKKIVDITNQDDCSEVPPLGEFRGASWHGTMTSVVCAGDGYLGNGLYKGIACDAELVLLKVQDQNGRITTNNIVKALQWVLNNHLEYGIRVINMSLGDDEAISYKQSEVDRLVEQLICENVVVVAAAGNDQQAAIKPPANSPHVITVGGLDDENQLGRPAGRLYHSPFGATTDGLMKPELIAQAIWIAAPILPETNEHAESQVLHRLLALRDDQLLAECEAGISQTGLDTSALQSKDAGYIREAIARRIQECKYIGDHYMHVDGTSFAAPIVSAIVAQLLEANPALSPPLVREILFSTAKRITTFPAERQGFGIVSPRRALLKVLKRETFLKPVESPRINEERNTIEFYLQHDCASQVSLAGTFNQWAQDVLLLEPGRHGLWKIEIQRLPAGRYGYKFFVDEKEWIEDVGNPFREPDGFNGFNSILHIQN